MALHEINTLSQQEACRCFLDCCGAHRWAEAMAQARPFASESSLMVAASRVWYSLAPEDWLEAFAAHPKIGDLDSLPRKHASTAALVSSEQAAATTRDATVQEALKHHNALYEQQFGYIYIVCASGKSAPELLEKLQQRLSNPPETELKVAADEQLAITKLRLQKLL